MREKRLGVLEEEEEEEEEEEGRDLCFCKQRVPCVERLACGCVYIKLCGLGFEER